MTKNAAKKQSQFIIEVEGLIPAKISFRTMAENEEQAFEIYEKKSQSLQVIHSPRIMPGKIIPKKISIRKSTSVMINWIRKIL